MPKRGSDLEQQSDEHSHRELNLLEIDTGQLGKNRCLRVGLRINAATVNPASLRLRLDNPRV